MNGSNGIDGLNGLAGSDGINGSNGVNGTNGSNGVNGTNGSNGVNGTNGLNGVDGTSGSNGINGTNGSNGIAGTNGSNGVDGTSGSNGIDGTDGMDTEQPQTDIDNLPADGDIIAALQSHGCTISANTADMSNVLMLFFAFLYWFAEKSRLFRASGKRLSMSHVRKVFVAAALGTAGFFASTAVADESDDVADSDPVLIGNVIVNDSAANTATNGGYSLGRFYLGVGLGLSYLDPELEPNAPFTTGDNLKFGGSVMLGYDLNRRLSLELLAADLGSIDINPDGQLGYQTYGLSGLFYVVRNTPALGKTAFSPYVRAGYRRIELHNNDDLPVRAEADKSLMLGGGIQFDRTSRIGARLELISFAGDARLLQAALLYRFGGGNKGDVPAATNIISVVNNINIQEPIEPVDTDQDEVPDDQDECPETRVNLAVSEDGCAIYDGVIQDVNFKTASHELALNAQRVLRTVVDTLTRFPNTFVTVSAHTDSRGTDPYNQSLSERRARSVVHFLVSNGISSNRLKFTAYGETRPIATNANAAGRAKNRRVELVAERITVSQ